MPDSNDPSTKEPQPGEVVKTVAELVLKDEDLKKSLGRRTIYAILFTLAVATVELTIGIPFITLGSTPLVGITVSFLIAVIEDWVWSRRPPTAFYICPEEGGFIPIKRSSHPKYRKLRSCPNCGCELIRRCQRGNHFIVSPDPDNPNTPPKLEGFCPFCKPSLPKSNRAYLPAAKKPADSRSAAPVQE
ncbi:MAG: hypothetical protein ACREA2_10445 [Blastocatellia bacterium]